jgi:enediyne biosynthesis protein E4
MNAIRLIAWSSIALSAVAARPPALPKFVDIAADAGLRFEHVNGASGQYHLPEIMGAGGALLDTDGDGDLDVVLLQGRSFAGASASTLGGPRLFRNALVPTRQLRFDDVTARSGFVGGDYGMGAAAGDYDNDGDPDLYITNFGPNRLYRNDRGTFTDVTARSGDGLDDPRWSTSASFADFDSDGDLDLFVVNYVDFTVAGAKACYDVMGIRDYCGPLQFRPLPDRLFRNDGNGRFTDVSEAAGITRAVASGLGVSAADFNGDRRLDFFVANDARPNQLWINSGHGTFDDAAMLAGVALNADGQVEGSMGVAAGDADNDGDDDLFVSNITGETHAFYENLGAGRFADRRLNTRLAAATRPYTGFGTDWFDYDSDGWLDLFVANGAVTILEALRGERAPFRQRNLLLRNTGRGAFDDVTAGAGAALQASNVGRGAAFGDVDNDGDVDVLVTNNGGPVRLLRNDTPRAGAAIVLRLEGVADNRQGLGARVGARYADGSMTWRRAHADGSYLSSSDPRVHVAGGAHGVPVDILVEWLRGPREQWPAATAGTTLRQGTGQPAPPVSGR